MVEVPATLESVNLTLMAKKSTKVAVALGHPDNYVFSFMANRLSIEPEEDFTVVHFGSG